MIGAEILEDLSEILRERGSLLVIVLPHFCWSAHDYWVARFRYELFLPSFLFFGVMAINGPVIAAWDRGNGWWLWIWAPVAYVASALLRRRFLTELDRS